MFSIRIDTGSRRLVGGDADDRHLMRTVRCWRGQLDKVNVSKAVDLGLVIVSAEHQHDVGIAQRLYEVIAIGDGVEAEMQGDDDRRSLGQWPDHRAGRRSPRR